MARRPIVVACLLPLLGACNMLMSESPILGEADRATVLPKDGLWFSSDPDCPVDTSQPEATWPDCALWIVVRNGTDFHLIDGKGQSEQLKSIIAEGSPLMLQAAWTDTAKEPIQTHYGFYAVEPSDPGADARFTAATVWPVECGIQKDSEIIPFPGVGSDCRAQSKAVIWSAAKASRRPAQISEWRWLRAEQP